MYTGTLKRREIYRFEESISTHDTSWCSLYVLADFLDMEQLAEAALVQIKECHELGDWLPSPEDIKFIYNHTGGYSPLRSFVVKELVVGFPAKSASGFAADKQAWSMVLGAHMTFTQDAMGGINRHTDIVKCDRESTCLF